MKKRIRTIAVITVLAMVMSCIPGMTFAATAKPGAVTISKCSQSTVSTKTILKWKKSSGKVNGYEIYRKSGTDSYKKIKTVTSAKTLKYTTGKQTVGKTYSYKIRAYAKKSNGSKVYGKYSKVKSLKITNIEPKFKCDTLNMYEKDGNVITDIRISSDKNNAKVLLDLDDESLSIMRAVGDSNMISFITGEDMDALLEKFDELEEDADFDQILSKLDKGVLDTFTFLDGTVKYGDTESAMKTVTAKTGSVILDPGKTKVIHCIVPSDSKLMRLKLDLTEDEYGRCVDIHAGSIPASKILLPTEKSTLDYVDLFLEYKNDYYDVICTNKDGKVKAELDEF